MKKLMKYILLIIIIAMTALLVFVHTNAVQGPGVNQPGSGDGALKLDASGRIGINQNVGSITERLHIGGILRAKKLIGGYNGGVTADRIGDPVLGGGAFNNGAVANFAFPTSLAVGAATTTGVSTSGLSVDGIFIASGTIYSAASAIPVFSKEWTLNADWNAAGTLFDPGLENPAANDELKLKKDVYKYRRTLTIDGAKITGNLTDFPVLIKLTSVNFDFFKAQPDGDDIRFASTTTGLGYKYETESWNTTSGEAYIWVKIPSLVAGQSQNFYMYYGNDLAVSAASPTEVWDSNFVMVQHLEESPANNVAGHFDSTSNGNHGMPKNFSDTPQSTTNTNGKINGADRFDGSDDEVEVGDSVSLDSFPSKITVESWVNIDDVSVSQKRIAEKKDVTSQQGWIFTTYYISPTAWGLMLGLNNETVCSVAATNGGNGFGIGSWIHTVGTYNSANSPDSERLKTYINGVRQGVQTGSCPSMVQTNVPLSIAGRSDATASSLDGFVDEIRLSNTARSAGWVKASYESGANTLLTYGAEEGL